MIGSKLYQKKQRMYLFLALYGILALLGIAFSIVMVSRDQDPSAAAGFMVIFGAGMCIRTYLRGKKPLVIVGQDQLELNQTNRAEYVRFKDIAGTERRGAGQLAVKVREGHATKTVIIYLRYLEKEDADQLESFLSRKGWKR